MDWQPCSPSSGVREAPEGLDIHQIWFGLLIDQAIHRGTHQSVQTLDADIGAWSTDLRRRTLRLAPLLGGGRGEADRIGRIVRTWMA